MVLRHFLSLLPNCAWGVSSSCRAVQLPGSSGAVTRRGEKKSRRLCAGMNHEGDQ